MQRRSFVVGALVGAPLIATAQNAGPLRLGVDLALADSGLGRALQLAFGRDTGIGVQLVRSPALSMLDALSAGELDAGLCNAPSAEARLDQQGLVYDRRPIAVGDFVIVGPTAGARSKDPAGLAGGRGLVAALRKLREAAGAEGATVAFVSANDGSGAHAFEQAAWRLAEIAPQAPWYQAAAAGAELAESARTRGAYAIVERGSWIARGGKPLAILVEGDPQMGESVHAMRSFRSPHPAGKLFIGWIAGARGRAVAASHRGYRAAAG